MENLSFNTTYTTEYQNDLVKRSVKLRDNWFINGETAPFAALLRGKGRIEKETNQRFEWLETRPNKIVFKVEPVQASTTTLTISGADSASFLDVNSILKVCETKEQMKVVDVKGKKITVVRGYGTTEAQNIAVDPGKDANDNPFTTCSILNLSRAFPEGSLAPEGTALVKKDNFNFSQIFRDTVDITRNELENPRYGDDGAGGGDKRRRRRTEIFKTHQIAIEHQLLFGEPKRDLTTKKPLHVSGGLTHYIQTNITKITDPAEWHPSRINSIMGSMADFGATGDKILMAGSGFLDKLDANAISIFGGSAGATFTKYGVVINEIATRYGKLNVVYNPVLSAAYPNLGIFVDMSNVWLHVIKDTTLETNIQIQGYDGIIDTYITDCGLEVANEERHALLYLNF